MRSHESDLQKLAEKKEVFLHDDLPFEAPAKAFVPGPYFKNIEEVAPDLGERELSHNVSSESDEESPKTLPVDRRDFMRLFGLGAVAASTACVRRPVEKIVPYVDNPKDQVPGQPVNYASTIDGVGVVVKTREGRPVFIEGNPQHPLSQGAVSQLAMSELQALYHPDRRKSPTVRYGTNRVADVSWDEAFERIASKLKDAKSVGILARATGGHSYDFYKDVLKKLGQSEDRLYMYEPNALKVNQAAAYKMAYGVEGLPRTDIARSDLIVSIGSDFLDLGVANIFESKSWSRNYSFGSGTKGKMVVFESRMTNTGGIADERYAISPGDELALSLGLVRALLDRDTVKGSVKEKTLAKKIVSQHKTLINETVNRLGVGDNLSELANDLLKKRGLVLVGESSANSVNGTLVQLAGILANALAGAVEKKTLHFDRGWMVLKDGGKDINRFLNDVENLDFLFVIDVNPAFTLPAATGIKEKLAKVGSVASIQSMPCETDKYAEFVLNGHNVLESWGDEQLVAGFWSLVQPVVNPISGSRQAEDIFLWSLAKMGRPLGAREYRDYLMDKWKVLFKQEPSIKFDFDTFFKAIQRKGFYGKIASRGIADINDFSDAFRPQPIAAGRLKLSAYLDPRLIDGKGADRPVLQEKGDSLTTVAWDSWVAMSPNAARKLGLRYNDLVKVKTSSGEVKAAIYPLPGMHDDTVAIARGNGHDSGSSRVMDGVGVDPLQLLSSSFDSITGLPATYGEPVEIIATGRKYRLAAQQKHNDIANRSDILKTVSFQSAVMNVRREKDLDKVPDIYPELPSHPDYRWGMAIDLDKCTGCGACTVACDLENNVPQVGRQQILRGREMHWLRVDRYFSGAVDNPSVSYQPVGCQHCNHAPCEGVCPVYATLHDEMGMNNQNYARCVGTRYCANACPYKVRRFNWFTHKWGVMGDRPMDRNPRALNPDVTVRTRGIMEKCTFCVQRINRARHDAKLEDRKVRDREIQTACESVCPTDAIVFGNLKDKNSRVARMRRDNRSYLMLGGDPEHGHYGIKTLPNVSYMAKVVLDEKGAHAASSHGEKSHEGDL